MSELFNAHKYYFIMSYKKCPVQIFDAGFFNPIYSKKVKKTNFLTVSIFFSIGPHYKLLLAIKKVWSLSGCRERITKQNPIVCGFIRQKCKQFHPIHSAKAFTFLINCNNRFYCHWENSTLWLLHITNNQKIYTIDILS